MKGSMKGRRGSTYQPRMTKNGNLTEKRSTSTTHRVALYRQITPTDWIGVICLIIREHQSVYAHCKIYKDETGQVIS